MEFYGNKEWYFEMQKRTASDYIIPFLGSHLKKNAKVCEIGCAEAGVLKAFLDEGHSCVGIELSNPRLQLAKKYLKLEEEEGRIQLFNKNIFDSDFQQTMPFKFDLIILKDVIEHLPDKAKVLKTLKASLNEGGILFFAFPPWWMPFGGHQQITKSKVLKKSIYVHLLPKFLYRSLLQLSREKKSTVEELMELKETGINIGAMKRLLKKEDFSIVKDQHWFINPIYKYKFKLSPKKVIPPFKNILFLRNFYTTCYYVLFKPK